MRRIILFVLLSLVFFGAKVCAQQPIADSLQLQVISKNTTRAFNIIIGPQSWLYNGPVYLPYRFKTPTNANFKDTLAFCNGMVNYDGIVYTNVPLFYDITRQLVVSRLYDGVVMYTLQNDLLYDFDLLGHHFVNFQPDNLNKKMAAGFYDELYNGNIKLFARRIKVIKDENAGGVIRNVFIEKDEYFLKKGTEYYEITGEGKLLELMKDKKNEMKQYTRDNKIKYKDSPEKNMIALVNYYDHLTK